MLYATNFLQTMQCANRFKRANASTVLALGLVCCAAAPALAKTAPQVGAPEPSPWTVGVFSLAEWQPYEGGKAKGMVLPYVGYDNGVVRWQGPTLEVQVGASTSSASSTPAPTGADPQVALALRAQYMGDGYTADDSLLLAGMQSRRASVWVGPSATARYAWGQVSGQWLADGLGHSKGHQARLAVSTFLPLGPIRIAPRIAWVWHDGKTVDYYYGVRNEEALPGRPAYQGRSGSSIELGLSSVVPLDSKQALVVDVSALKLGSAIQDSPLVGRKVLTKLRLAYTYRF